MRRSPWTRGGIFLGLLAVSLALHPAASAGRGAQVLLFVLLGVLGVAAAWSAR